MIEISGESVETGVRLVGQTGEALTEIVESVSAIATEMQGIAQASTSQSEGMAEINEGMKLIEGVTLSNYEMAGQTSDAGLALGAEAEKMHQVMRGFATGDVTSGAITSSQAA